MNLPLDSLVNPPHTTFANKVLTEMSMDRMEGIGFYILMMIGFTIIYISKHKRIENGLAGADGWQGPELVVFVFIIILPQFFGAIVFLHFTPPRELYWFMGFLLIYVVLGKATVKAWAGGIVQKFTGAKIEGDKVITEETEKSKKVTTESIQVPKPE